MPNDCLFTHAAQLYNERRYQEAVDVLAQYIESERRSGGGEAHLQGAAHALTVMSTWYMEMGLGERQMECLEESIELYKNLKNMAAYARFNTKLLGDCYFFNKQYRKALSCYDTVFDNYRDTLRVYRGVLSSIAPVAEEEYLSRNA